MSTKDQIKRFLKHPVSWISGGALSVFAVFAALGVKPLTVIATVFAVMFNNAMTIFTGASILGFTIGPQLQGIPIIGTVPTLPFKIIAVVFGLIAVAKIGAQLWDSFKSRLRGG